MTVYQQTERDLQLMEEDRRQQRQLRLERWLDGLTLTLIFASVCLLWGWVFWQALEVL